MLWKIIQTNILLRFEEAEREASFKSSFQHMLPFYLLGFMIVTWINLFAGVIPRYFFESNNNGFVWAREDPRTLFFSLVATFVLLTVFLTVVAGLAVKKRLPSKINIEMVTVVCLSAMLAILPCVNFLRIAGLYGTDASLVFANITGIECFCASEVINVMQIDALLTAMNLFLPLRCCLMWIPNTVSVASYAFFLIHSGGDHMNSGNGDGKNTVVLVVCTVVLFSWIGARRNERSAREKWLSLNQSEQVVQEQKSDLVHLEAKLQAMHSLMNTVCDVVFFAGQDLQVSHVCTHLDELFGPMKGRCLSEVMADKAQCQRFDSVVSSLLSSDMPGTVGENQDAVNRAHTTVLVPPVKFARMNAAPTWLSQADDCYEAFEAEVLVADTGMWHSSASAGDGSWRYLVGLKGMTPCSSLDSESGPEVIVVQTCAEENRAQVDSRLQVIEEGTEISFELSASRLSEASSSYNHFTNLGIKGERKDVASQTTISPGLNATLMTPKPLMQDNSTEPLLDWKHDGWQCRRCQKPPRMPPPQQQKETADLSRKESKDGSGTPESSRMWSPESSRLSLLSGDAEVHPTPEATMLYHIRDAVRAWSLQQGTGQSHQCCQLHAGLTKANHILQTALDWPCDPEWKPFSAGQCTSCSCMLSSLDKKHCDICGADLWPNVSRFPVMYSDPSLISLAQIEASGSVSAFAPRSEEHLNVSSSAEILSL